MTLETFYALGLALVVVGIAIIVIALIIASTRCIAKEKGKISGAGVIMIGPIPIIFGTDKKSVKVVLALALALTIVMLIIMLLYYWWLR